MSFISHSHPVERTTPFPVDERVNSSIPARDMQTMSAMVDSFTLRTSFHL